MTDAARIEPVALEGRHRPARAARPRPRRRASPRSPSTRRSGAGRSPGRRPRRSLRRLGRGGARARATPARSCPFATLDVATGRPIGSSRYMNIVLEHRRLEIGWTWVAPRLAAERRQPRGEAADAGPRVRRRSAAGGSSSRPTRSTSRRGPPCSGSARRSRASSATTWSCPAAGMRHSAYYSVIDEEWPAVKARLERSLRR